MDPITIEREEGGGFTVRQGDRYSDHLAYEEMIGVVIAMSQPEEYLDRFRNWMLTEEEWRLKYPMLFRNREEKPKETKLLEMK